MGDYDSKTTNMQPGHMFKKIEFIFASYEKPFLIQVNSSFLSLLPVSSHHFLTPFLSLSKFFSSSLDIWSWFPINIEKNVHTLFFIRKLFILLVLGIFYS